MAKKEEIKEVAVKEEAEVPVEMNKEDMQVMFNLRENLDGITPRLPQIKIAHSAQMFIMPEGNKVETFTGILLDMTAPNGFWEEKYVPGETTPPVCSSLDGRRPDMMSEKLQCKTCKECEKNQFGTSVNDDGSPGKGKACKNMKRLHILIGEGVIPYRLTTSATSISAIDLYISLVTNAGFPYQLVETEFSLVQKDNYSILVMKKVGVITDMTRAGQIKKMLETYKPIMRGEEILSDETGE